MNLENLNKEDKNPTSHPENKTEQETFDALYQSLLVCNEGAGEFWKQYEENDIITKNIESGAVHEKIKKEFLDKNIDPGELRELLFYLDQYGNHTQTAQHNIELLEDEAVEDTFFARLEEFDFKNKEQKQRAENLYPKMKSIAYFHNAQNKFFLGENGAEFFEKAFHEAQKVKNDTDYDSWFLYTEASRAYFSGDLARLYEISHLISDIFDREEAEIRARGDENSDELLWGLRRNGEIITNFIASLERGENPIESYIDVYHK